MLQGPFADLCQREGHEDECDVVCAHCKAILQCQTGIKGPLCKQACNKTQCNKTPVLLLQQLSAITAIANVTSDVLI